MKVMRRLAVVAVPVLLAVTFAACGGSGNPCGENPLGPGCRATPTPSPSPVTTTEVLFSDNGPFPAESVGYVQFSIPRGGRVDALVDWTFASSMVAVAMTTSSCDDWEAAFAGQCGNIGTPSVSRTLKPKTVSGSVTQPGLARLWIVNLATVEESMAAHITLTSTGAASTPVAPTSFSRSFVPVATGGARPARAFPD